MLQHLEEHRHRHPNVSVSSLLLNQFCSLCPGLDNVRFRLDSVNGCIKLQKPYVCTKNTVKLVANQPLEI